MDRRYLVDRLAVSTTVCGAVCHAWLVLSQQSGKECGSNVLKSDMHEDLDSARYVGEFEHTCDITVFYKFGLI